MQAKINNFNEKEDTKKVIDNWDKIYEKLKSNSIFAKLLDDVIELYTNLSLA